MQELTDTMLSQDMGDAGGVAIFFPLIVLLIVLLILVWGYIAKKKLKRK